MSHRLMDEVVDLEAQLAQIDGAIAAAVRADVVDLQTVTAMRRRRQELQSWLAKANEAIAR